MPPTDPNWRAKSALPTVHDHWRPTSWNADIRHPSGLGKATNGSDVPDPPSNLGSPASYNTNTENPSSHNSTTEFSGSFGNPTRSNSNPSFQDGFGNPTRYDSNLNASGAIGNPTNSSGRTNHVNGNGNNMTANYGTVRSSAIAVYHSSTAHLHLSQEALGRELHQENAKREKPPISTPPGLRRPVPQNNCNKNSNGQGNSMIHSKNAGPSDDHTNTKRHNRERGYFNIPVNSAAPKVDFHPTSSKETIAIDPITFNSRMTVAYGFRRPLPEETPVTVEDKLKCFLSPFESTEFAMRMLVQWPVTQIHIMAADLTYGARLFCSKAEDRDLVTLQRVLWLRQALVWRGLCVEPRIGRAFIVEGCRMLASFNGKSQEFRTVQKLMSCFTLMLKTVIVAHPGHAREWVPIWELPREISIAKSNFTDSRGERLPGGYGVYTDAKGLERPLGAVFMGKKYCTLDGCITCGTVHPPSYFETAYPKLAKAIMAKEKSDYEAKKPEIRQELQKQRNKQPSVSLNLTGELFSRRRTSRENKLSSDILRAQRVE